MKWKHVFIKFNNKYSNKKKTPGNVKLNYRRKKEIVVMKLGKMQNKINMECNNNNTK